MSLHEKGDQTRAPNHNSDFSDRFRVDFPNSQTFANFTSENPVRFRRRFKTGIFGLLYLSAGGCAVFIGRASGTE